MIDAINYVYPKKALEVFGRHSRMENFGNGELEMTSMSMMTMENEVLAYVNADFLRPGRATSHGDDRLRVAGTRGVIESIRNELRLINQDNDGTTPLDLMKPPTIFEDFLNAVKTGKGEMTSESALNATYLSLKLRESADTVKLIVL
jgi:hypothetical protein